MGVDMHNAFNASIHRLLFPLQPLKQITLDSSKGMQDWTDMFLQLQDIVSFFSFEKLPRFESLLVLYLIIKEYVFEFSYQHYKTNIFTRSLLHVHTLLT
jgi:hypothetical protein